MSFPGGSVVKNPPANAGDSGDMGLILGSGRSPEAGSGNSSSILARIIPWTEEPGVATVQGVGKSRTRLNY